MARQRLSGPKLQHPYLYFSRKDIPRLKEKLRHPWIQRKWQTFLRRAETIMRYGLYPKPHEDSSPGTYTAELSEGCLQFYRRAPLLAFVSLLTDESRYLKRAKEHLLHVCSYRVWGGYDVAGRFDPGLAAGLFGIAVAMVYDWLFEELSASERQLVRDSLAEKTVAPYLQKYLVDEPNAMPGPELNWPAQWFGGVGLAGLALWQEHPEAPRWVKHAEDVMRETVYWANDADGGGLEGIHYLNYLLSNVLFFAYPLRTVTGTSLFDSPFLKNASLFSLYGTYEGPDEMWQLNISDAFRGDLVPTTKKHSEGFIDYSATATAMTILGLAREYRDRSAMWLFGKWLETVDPQDKVLGETWNHPLEVVWFDPSLPPEPPAKLPLSRHFRGIDWIVCRSGWEKTDTLLAFKSGRARWWHVHGDVNHFILWANGEQLLIDPGIGPYVFQKTEAERLKAAESMEKINTYYRVTGHNVLIVDGEGQLAEASTSDYRRYGRHAGRAESIEQGGRIHDFLDGDFAWYLRSEGSRPYYGRLRAWTRHLFSAGLRCLVLYDEIECNGRRSIEWTLHSPKDLTVDGDTVTLRKGGRDLMSVHVLDRGSMRLQRKDGYNEGQIWITPDEKVDSASIESFLPKADILSLETLEKVDRAHFLCLIDVHRDGRPMAARIESVRGENCRGVTYHDQGEESIAVFRTGPGTMEAHGMSTGAGFASWSPGRGLPRYLVSEADWLELGGLRWMSCDRPVTLALEYTERGFVGRIKTITRVYLKLRLSACPGDVAIDGEPAEYHYDDQSQLVTFVVHRGTFGISGSLTPSGRNPKYFREFPEKREIIF